MSVNNTVDEEATYAYDPKKIRKSELPDGSAYALEAMRESISELLDASDLADKVDDVLKGVVGKEGGNK